MGVSNEQIDRAVAAAEARKAQGYFQRAHSGDGRAASLFARLVAFDVNPNGSESDFGWLSKQPNETNFDGYADGAIVFSADSSNAQNVLKLVVNVGAFPSSIGRAIQERRLHNKWVKPVALSSADMAYLLNGGQPLPVPAPQPPATLYPPPTGAELDVFQTRVKRAYVDVNRTFPDPNDMDAYNHFAYFGYSCRVMSASDAAHKHIAELRLALHAGPELIP